MTGGRLVRLDVCVRVAEVVVRESVCSGVLAGVIVGPGRRHRGGDSGRVAVGEFASQSRGRVPSVLAVVFSLKLLACRSDLAWGAP